MSEDFTPEVMEETQNNASASSPEVNDALAVIENQVWLIKEIGQIPEDLYTDQVEDKIKTTAAAFDLIRAMQKRLKKFEYDSKQRPDKEA